MSRAVVGRFELHDVIGQGGMSRVYRGRHTRELVDVAIKLVTADVARSRRCRDALANEVRAMARLDHPGIIHVLDYGQVDAGAAAQSEELAAGSPYLVMELASEGMLALEDVGDWETLRSTLGDLLLALSHAHARGVVHRDLKPSNILRASADRPLQLSDFGIAHALAYGAERDDPLQAGTAAFMAPEQILGLHNEEGPGTDLYALGCLAYYLCSGQLPFRGARPDVLRSHCLEPASGLEPAFTVPADLESWIRILMAKRPEHRFECAADAHRALQQLGGKMLVPVPATPPLPGSDRPTQLETEAISGPRTSPQASSDVGDSGIKRTGTARDPQPTWHETRADLALELTRRGPPAWTERERRLHVVPPIEELPETLPGPKPLWGIGLGVYGLRPIPIAGRDAEQRKLWDLLRACDEDGKPRVAVVVGRAGFGKTRLAEWLAERVLELGAASVMWAGHSDGDNEDGLQRLLLRYFKAEGLRGEALKERLLFAIGGHDLESEQREQLEAWFEPDSDHAMRREERFALVRRFLTHLSARRPVVMVLDDVQFSAESIAFARSLVAHEAKAPLPLLVVLTARQEALEERAAEAAELAQLSRHPRAESLGLGPLDPDAHARLIGDLLGLEPALAEDVAERTDGSPLFAVQLVGDWVQRGVLVPGAEGFRLRGGEEPSIPDDLHDLWTSRIDRLLNDLPTEQRPDAELALEVWAALGRRVRLDDWNTAVELRDGEVPDGLLDHLANRRLALVGRRRLTAVHGLLLESLRRRSIEAGRWPEINLACAQALHTRAGDTQPERRARHLLAGNAWDEALQPLLQAAGELQRRSQYDEATVVCGRYFYALDALKTERDDPRVVRGWLALAETEALRGRVEQAERALRQVLVLLHEGHDAYLRSHASRLQGGLAHKRGKPEEALAHYQKAAQLAESIDAEHFQALALHGQGEVLKMLGQLEESAAHYVLSGTLFDRCEDRLGMVRVRIGLADVYRRRGQLDEAEEILTECHALTRRMGNRYSQGVAANSLGDIARQRGRLADAEAHYRDAIASMEELGSEEAAIVQMNLGLTMLVRERFGPAREALNGVVPRFEAVGREGFKAYAMAGLLSAAAGLQDWDEFDECYLTVMELLESTKLVDNDMAVCFEQAGDLASAAGMMERARRAWQLSLDQWERLDIEARAAAIRGRLQPDGS